MKLRSVKPRLAIDLFSGCGGLSLGLRRAGFEVVAAIDNDSISVATYRLNHPSTVVKKEDIDKSTPLDLLEELGLAPGQLDLMAGCPPCQGFSTLRTLNGGREVEDDQNDLVFDFVRYVDCFRPKALMLENVPGLLADKRSDTVRRRLERMGYECCAEVFDAARFGVPQRRRRMIMLGARGSAPAFAKTTRRRTVSQAIRFLPPPEQSKDPVHNYDVRRAAKVLSLIRRIPKDGGSRTDLPLSAQLPCHRDFDGFRDIYGRMAWRNPGPTITGGCINPSKGRFVHPEEDRAITLREAALLQGFPVSYVFDLSRGRYPVAQLIGNAFPPKFAEHFAKAIYRHLEEAT